MSIFLITLPVVTYFLQENSFRAREKQLEILILEQHIKSNEIIILKMSSDQEKFKSSDQAKELSKEGLKSLTNLHEELISDYKKKLASDKATLVKLKK